MSAEDAAELRRNARENGAACTTADCDCEAFDYDRPNLFGACPACRHQERDHRPLTAVDRSARARISESSRRHCQSPDCLCSGFRARFGSRLHGDLLCETCSHSIAHHRDLSKGESAVAARLLEAEQLPCAASASLAVSDGADAAVAPAVLRPVRDPDDDEVCPADRRPVVLPISAPAVAATDGDAVDDDAPGDMCECTAFRQDRAAILPRFKGLSATETRDAVALLPCLSCGHALSSHRRRTVHERKQAERAMLLQLRLLQLEPVTRGAANAAVVAVGPKKTSYIVQATAEGAIAARPLVTASDAASATRLTKVEMPTNVPQPISVRRVLSLPRLTRFRFRSRMRRCCCRPTQRGHCLLLYLPTPSQCGALTHCATLHY